MYTQLNFFKPRNFGDVKLLQETVQGYEDIWDKDLDELLDTYNDLMRLSELFQDESYKRRAEHILTYLKA
ncbi:hypothetical protein IMZ31_19295 (plasmid) [Pontibacillus sp. ALD_SL1]|uniref:hypothetical protein n=1 Tax=Pontibacillus sp. ALD_SL1 TaxID=2777185 RepID=UPI001A95864E|nr:hypothetical protein [Pontibacillus sp. ALD_SL1]QST02696.1 hypothetical protein IMZ31_19295 [Pontibacillus sp. ALD_SL1]